MNIYRRLLATIFCASASAAFGLGMVWAAENACEDAVTTAEMRECIDRRYARVDGELNRVYQRLMLQIADERRAPWQDAQRAWIEFRDQNAAFVASDVQGGTLYPVLEVAERASMTEHRIEELKEHLR